MPATSKAQQRFFGMVHAAQKGGRGSKSPEVARAARSMDPKSVGHFAGTKHKGLPGHVKKKASDIAADAATVLAAHTPAFTKVAQEVRRHGDLHWAIFNAFPLHTKQARERIFSLLVKAAANLQKKANMLPAPAPAQAPVGDMMGMGAAMGGMAGDGAGMPTTPPPTAPAVPTTAPMSFNGPPAQASSFPGF